MFSAQLSLAVGAFTVKLNAKTNARVGVWGSGNTAIAATINATWSSTAIASNFFHGGGQVRMRVSQPTIATAQDTAWQTMFTAMGTLSILLASATQSGTGGSLTSLGYQSLTPALRTVFSATGGGAYAANQMTVQVATITNGVQFILTLTEAHQAVGIGPDSVNSGTTMAMDVVYIGSAGGTGVAPLPTFTQVDPL